MDLLRKWMRIWQFRRIPLAQAHDVNAIPRVVHVQGEQAAEPPEVGAIGIPESGRPEVGPQAIEVEDHLDGSAVDLAEVHHAVGRIGRSARWAREVRDVGHEA
jgi:hypothetical protein